ncbi:LytR C-terminal domain-containing protein [Streptomyces sp. NPDC091292]|uniref:LytR C-terminal domain-containing protein n=1 Tax=Streptomyces sp. NPDC091292 TaxID=3365991 RepID=UPI0038160CF6
MSMLTPPGMGGRYRITGDKYPRMRPGRRRSRIVLALVASTASLGLIGWGTLQLVDVFTGGGQATAAGPRAGCPPKSTASTAPQAAVSLPRPGGIKVNVLNATPRSGLAKQTADELKKRGFAIGQVGNASKEYDKKVAGTGIVLGPKAAAEGALPVLAAQLAGAEQKTDARAGGDVDLILGTAFTRLAPAADATKALTALTTPPSPSPTPCKR